MVGGKGVIWLLLKEKVKLYLYFIKQQDMKMYGVDVPLHTLLYQDEWPAQKCSEISPLGKVPPDTLQVDIELV
jgi:hypothetical protein